MSTSPASAAPRVSTRIKPTWRLRLQTAATYRLMKLLKLDRWTRPMAYIELSSRCNALCVFCPYPAIADSDKKLQKMPAASFQTARENIEKEGFSSVSFTPTTGEIFLDENWAERVAEVIALDSVKLVYFYSNGILLHEKNRAKLLQLAASPKLELYFSLGGPDREAYRALYKVDQFEKVVRNLVALLGELAAGGFKTRVNIQLRQKRTEGRASRKHFKEFLRLFDSVKYEKASFHGLSSFDPIGDSIRTSDLIEVQPRQMGHQQFPCSAIRNKRYAADGSVWVCGCVTSELPGDSSLRIGHVDEGLEELTRRQEALFQEWRDSGRPPKTCEGCTFYTPTNRERDGTAFKYP